METPSQRWAASIRDDMRRVIGGLRTLGQRATSGGDLFEDWATRGEEALAAWERGSGPARTTKRGQIVELARAIVLMSAAFHPTIRAQATASMLDSWRRALDRVPPPQTAEDLALRIALVWLSPENTDLTDPACGEVLLACASGLVDDSDCTAPRTGRQVAEEARDYLDAVEVDLPESRVLLARVVGGAPLDQLVSPVKAKKALKSGKPPKEEVKPISWVLAGVEQVLSSVFGKVL